MYGNLREEVQLFHTYNFFTDCVWYKDCLVTEWCVRQGSLAAIIVLTFEKQVLYVYYMDGTQQSKILGGWSVLFCWLILLYWGCLYCWMSALNGASCSSSWLWASDFDSSRDSLFCMLIVLEFNMTHVRQKSIKAWPYCILKALPFTSNQCFPWPVLRFSYLHRKQTTLSTLVFCIH